MCGACTLDRQPETSAAKLLNLTTAPLFVIILVPQIWRQVLKLTEMMLTGKTEPQLDKNMESVLCLILIFRFIEYRHYFTCGMQCLISPKHVFMDYPELG